MKIHIFMLQSLPLLDCHDSAAVILVERQVSEGAGSGSNEFEVVFFAVEDEELHALRHVRLEALGHVLRHHQVVDHLRRRPPQHRMILKSESG